MRSTEEIAFASFDLQRQAAETPKEDKDGTDLTDVRLRLQLVAEDLNAVSRGLPASRSDCGDWVKGNPSPTIERRLKRPILARLRELRASRRETGRPIRN